MKMEPKKIISDQHSDGNSSNDETVEVDRNRYLIYKLDFDYNEMKQENEEFY